MTYSNIPEQRAKVREMDVAYLRVLIRHGCSRKGFYRQCSRNDVRAQIKRIRAHDEITESWKQSTDVYKTRNN